MDCLCNSFVLVFVCSVECKLVRINKQIYLKLIRKYDWTILSLEYGLTINYVFRISIKKQIEKQSLQYSLIMVKLPVNISNELFISCESKSTFHKFPNTIFHQLGERK